MLIFARLEENYKLLGNIEKILEVFDEHSIENLNFYLFLGKVVAKNKAFGNNIIFLQQFFPVRGVWTSPNPPEYATVYLCAKTMDRPWVEHPEHFAQIRKTLLQKKDAIRKPIKIKIHQKFWNSLPKLIFNME